MSQPLGYDDVAALQAETARHMAEAAKAAAAIEAARQQAEQLLAQQAGGQG